MGIYDRDYYRGGQRGGARGFVAQTVVGRLILVNCIVFALQLIVGKDLTRFLACSADDLFSGFPEVWRLVTACFAHSTAGIAHILFNMFLLFMFGRELEQIYGKRDFLILYLVSGALAILCEASIIQLSASASEAAIRQVPILGASGSIMALVVLFGTIFPHRTVLLFFVIPVPMWVVCVLAVLIDIVGVRSGGTGIAHYAHLAGAAFGFAYRYLDLRWDSVRARLSRGLRGSGRSHRRPSRRSAGSTEPPPEDVSRRIDELLAKIHEKGMASLTDEERHFLLENSRKYRSP